MGVGHKTNHSFSDAKEEACLHTHHPIKSATNSIFSAGKHLNPRFFLGENGQLVMVFYFKTPEAHTNVLILHKTLLPIHVNYITRKDEVRNKKLGDF